MPSKGKTSARSRSSPDPHDCAPDRSSAVLLLIDVINDFDFPSASKLLRFARPAARKIAALKMRLARRGIPTIYVNDNFGRWQSDFQKVVDRCLAPDAAGQDIARLLQPKANDYFVLKPKHSGFYSTTLEVLLEYLGAQRLILTGFAADICVLYTANDAYMRDYELVVPADCVASETAAAKRTACGQMKRFLRADVRSAACLR
jgi:nicotinamidase-related amidase